MSVSSSASEPGAPLRASLGWILRGANLPVVAGLVALAIFASRAGPYDLRLLSIVGIYAILVIGFQFIFGYAGAVSLAQSCFFGVGAYVTGILAVHLQLGLLLTFPLSIVAAALLAAVVAAPVLKLDDHYFALATLAVTLLVELIGTQWESVTGGNNGLSGIPPINLFGVEIKSRFSVMLIVWLVLAVAALGAFQFGRGLYGRTFHLMRESRPVASAIGLDVSRMRFAAFVLSAVYGGAAGALMAHVIRVVSPDQLGLPLMITCLTMTVIGGRMSIAGAIVAALLLTYLRESFRVLENYTMIAYGSVTLAFLVVAPYGIVGAVERLRERFLPERPDPAPAPQPPRRAPAMAAAPRGRGRGEILRRSAGAGECLPLTSEGGEIGPDRPQRVGKDHPPQHCVGSLYRDFGDPVRERTSRAPPDRIARLGIARTFQHINLVDEISALDNIAIGRAVSEKVGLWRSLTAMMMTASTSPTRRA